MSLGNLDQPGLPKLCTQMGVCEGLALGAVGLNAKYFCGGPNLHRPQPSLTRRAAQSYRPRSIGATGLH